MAGLDHHVTEIAGGSFVGEHTRHADLLTAVKERETE
jgi:hypothetical protein